MVSLLKNRILQHVRHRAYEPQQTRELAEALGVEKSDLEEFRKAVDDLAEAGEVVLGASNTICLPPVGREVTGTFKGNERGFGFILPDEANSHGDLFVPPPHTGGAMTGDRVRAAVQHGKGDRGGKGPTAKVVEIIARKNATFAGVLEKRGKQWFVEPDGKLLNQPILVRDPSIKNAKHGDKVVVDLVKFPDKKQDAEGVITEVLGAPGEPDVETLAIMRAFGLAEAFTDEVAEETRQIVRDYEGEKQEAYFADRLDLRETFTTTIDPPDAKDFDDAITLERKGDGWELGVHIADVATFVTPGTQVDDEAKARGNSTYLPRRVIPMLPELLSNGICSLQPGVPRLAKSVFITYDSKGRVQKTRYANSVIASNHRMTYLEAQALIDGKPAEAGKHAVTENEYSDELIAAVQAMDKLARVIRARREEAGMISLDLPEVELIFDEQGNVVDAQPEDDAFTHKIIEAFMVEANEAVARTFADLEMPVIRRVHPDPSAHDTDALRRFARVAGFNIPQNPSRKELQNLLEATRGKAAAKSVHLAVLKTLTKAEYAPVLIGHFALASEHYLHFTSPIRRYPDLTAHRALDALFDALGNQHGSIPKSKEGRKQIAHQLRDDPRCPDEETLAEIGRHCSATERNSESAERELRNLLVLQLMEQHVGEQFQGTVTGVTGFGIFVQIDKYLVEGLIKLDALPGAATDRYQLDEHTGALIAQRSGRRIQIGDEFVVQIMKVDLNRREMDLMIIEDEQKSQHRKGRPRRDEPKKTPKLKGKAKSENKSRTGRKRSGRRGGSKNRGK